MADLDVVAAAISAAGDLPETLTVEQTRSYIARHIASALAVMDPRFDARAFLDACGVDGIE